MATYAEIAPIIEGAGIKKTAVENYFENLPEPKEQPEPPAITKSKIVGVADAYLVQGLSRAGGIADIASSVGLLPYQVKAIIKELNILKAAWDLAQSEE
jgi:hypothetical protein